jgi:hypothetical protein
LILFGWGRGRGSCTASPSCSDQENGAACLCSGKWGMAAVTRTALDRCRRSHFPCFVLRRVRDQSQKSLCLCALSLSLARSLALFLISLSPLTTHHHSRSLARRLASTRSLFSRSAQIACVVVRSTYDPPRLSLSRKLRPLLPERAGGAAPPGGPRLWQQRLAPPYGIATNLGRRSAETMAAFCFALLPVVCGLAFPLQGGAPSRMLRREAMLAGASAAAAAVLPRAAIADTTTPSGLSYKVIKTGSGGQPAVGDLITIRFKGAVKATGAVFDDIMSSVCARCPGHGPPVPNAGAPSSPRRC